MSYASSGLQMISGSIGGSGARLWRYVSADAHGAVDATDYFSDAKDRGMKANDIVFVVDTNSATCTVHYVSAIDSDGNGTLAAATLA
jgi:hypothetical protein